MAGERESSTLGSLRVAAGRPAFGSDSGAGGRDAVRVCVCEGGLTLPPRHVQDSLERCAGQSFCMGC